MSTSATRFVVQAGDQVKNPDTRTRLLRRWSALPLRLIVGFGFLAHGYAKVVNGPDHFAASLHALGVPAPDAMAWATIAVELVGGAAVLLGAWVPAISVPLATILLVAAITVHWQYGFSSIKLRAVTEAGPHFGPPGYETDLLYLAALTTLVLSGPGPLSVDQLIRRSRSARNFSNTGGYDGSRRIECSER